MDIMETEVEKLMLRYLRNADLNPQDIVTATDNLLKIYNQIRPEHAANKTALDTFMNELKAVNKLSKKLKQFQSMAGNTLPL